MTVNWGTKVISILQADSFMSAIGGGDYEIDLDGFRLSLKNEEDSADGMPFPDTHRHNTEVVLSGTTYARTVEIINGYTVTFEDVGSDYLVNCTGANHNLADVLNGNNVNLIVNNSGGLITDGGGSSGGQRFIWEELVF